MLFWIVVGAIAVAIASVLVPVLIGRGVGKGRRIPDVPVAPDNPNAATCREFCLQWDGRRTELFLVQADETAARNRADVLRSELATALAVVAGLLAAAIAAAAIPYFGWAVSIPFFAAATIAATAAGLIAGLLNAADEDVARKMTASRDARLRVAAARMQIDAHCQPAEADACLNRASP
jgi:type II secretory pathway component PulL